MSNERYVYDSGVAQSGWWYVSISSLLGPVLGLRFLGKDRTAFAFSDDMDRTNSNELISQSSFSDRHTLWAAVSTTAIERRTSVRVTAPYHPTISSLCQSVRNDPPPAYQSSHRPRRSSL